VGINIAEQAERNNVTTGRSSLAEDTRISRLFHVESNFSSQAELIRQQFDAQLYGATGQAGGISCLSYAFSVGAYGFLTTNAEQLFARTQLDALLDEIAEWGTQALGTAYVSTPQVRVYISGCSRTFARDEVDAKWHYLIWLTRFPAGMKSRGRVRLITDGNSSSRYSLTIHRTIDLEPKYNDLIVHDTACTYCLETRNLSVDPTEAIVFLDGYLW
jgi:hypothetical protein